MAVTKDRQGQGIGKVLLTKVFELAIQQHFLSGCAAVVVDSKPESVEFYRKYLFKNMRVSNNAPASPQTRMYLAIKTVLAAMEPVP